MKSFVVSVLLILYFIERNAQQIPVLKKQISLDRVSNVVSNEELDNILVVMNDLNYTLIDPFSKIQIGSIALGIPRITLPNIEQVYLTENTKFLISAGQVILKVDIVKQSIDTVFSEIQSDTEYIINYIPAPWNANILMIATNHLSNTMIPKDCRLILYDLSTESVVSDAPLEHIVTIFTPNREENTVFGGTFDGDIIEIDSVLNHKNLYNPFSLPLYSLVYQAPYLISTPHFKKELTRSRLSEDGTINIHNTESLVSQQISLNVQSEYKVNDLVTLMPTNQVQKIFPSKDKERVFVNYARNRLISLDLKTLDTVHYPVDKPFAEFYPYKKDQDIIYSAVNNTIGLSSLQGDLALYDLAKMGFTYSYDKPLKQREFTQIHKVFDEEGNYHYIGHNTKYSGYVDSLVIFSSYKIQPTSIILNESNVSIDYKNNLLSIGGHGLLSGKLHLEKLVEDSYTLTIDKASFAKSPIFTPKLSLYRFNEADFPDLPTNVVRTEYVNGHYLIYGKNYDNKGEVKYNIIIVDQSGNTVFKTPFFDNIVTLDDYRISANGKYLAYVHSVHSSQQLDVWDINAKKNVYSEKISQERFYHYTFDRNHPVIWYYIHNEEKKQSTLYKVDLTEKVPTSAYVGQDYGMFSFEIDMDNDLLVKEVYEEFSVVRLSDRNGLYDALPLDRSIQISQLPEGYLFSTASESHTYLPDGNRVVFTSFENNQWIEIVNDLLYRGSKQTLKNFGFVSGGRGFSPFDFDSHFNRPDTVLTLSGSTNPEINKLFYDVVEKRKKHYNIQNIGATFNNAPILSIDNRSALTTVTHQRTVELQLTTSASENRKVKHIHILNNGVPLYGKEGLHLDNGHQLISKGVIVPLINGKNEIHVFVEDDHEQYSVREFITLNSDFKPHSEEKVYFIGIGIDRYQDSTYNLSWSVKDIRDLAIALKVKFPQILIDTLFNEDVSKQNILALKERLNTLNLQDKVLISFSGHGVLSKDLNYFLSTYGINFDEPEALGLAYTDFENLLNDIKPLRKLLLIDACHSGELDREEVLFTGDYILPIGVKGAQPIGVPKTKTVGGTTVFELMQNLFVDNRKTTGTTIISAAAGTEFAYEGGGLSNGVFTHVVLEALRIYSTSTVSQLKGIVEQEVSKLTNGKQKPTSRGETLDFDWAIW